MYARGEQAVFGRADAHLPHGVRRDAAAVVGAHGHGHVRERAARGAGDSWERGVFDGDRGRRFGEAVPRREPDAEALLEEPAEALRRRTAAAPRTYERRQVRGRDVGMGEQVVDHRGDGRHRAHVFVADPGRQSHRVDAVDAHDTRTTLQRAHRSEHHQVQDGERQHHAEAVVGEGSVLDRDRADEQQVVLAVHHAFRPSGGAAGVRDRSGREGVDGHLGCAGRVGRRQELGPRTCRVAGLGVEHDSQRGERVAGGVDLRRRDALAEEHRDARVVEQVLLLGLREHAVHADPHRAEVHGGEERDDQLGVVAHAPGDPVARLHPAPRERHDGPANLVVERPVGEAGVASDHCLGVGPSCDRARQRFGHRLGPDREPRAARRRQESVGRGIGCGHA